VADRVSRYAGRDEVLRGIVDELRAQGEHWSVMQQERTRKVASSAAYYSQKSRSLDGEAIRRR
jgi:hypothetical protein